MDAWARRNTTTTTNQPPPPSPTTTTTPVCPSLVDWLKQERLEQGRPIRGGKRWRAMAGATSVDDSGLVLLCPREEQVYVERVDLVCAVEGKVSVGGGSSANNILPISRHFGRGDDPITLLSVPALTGDDAVAAVQAEFGVGVRGDAQYDPLDTRAPRRLVHCRSLTVQGEEFRSPEQLPDDLLIYEGASREFDDRGGSFVGRAALRDNAATTAYREINGAADGWPGWTVDRYDKWLYVQHDTTQPRGPLPPLRDDHTHGVYYVDDSTNDKTLLPGGRPAPTDLAVLENDVTYLVRLGDARQSTGLFLDQRPQRAWLRRHCGSGQRVLNCFAHTGAFSVAAAAAGAKTVSLDLDKKWLDRIGPQMESNGIEWDEEKHDAIYGDCFDWLRRLAKRGETFDLIILDPPSTSVGGKKKKRWSVKNDTAELVALVVPLLKPNSILWTVNNCSTLQTRKFANMVRRGFSLSEPPQQPRTCRLDSVVPMPVDFPTIGAQPVTNLVWRVT